MEGGVGGLFLQMEIADAALVPENLQRVGGEVRVRNILTVVNHVLLALLPQNVVDQLRRAGNQKAAGLRVIRADVGGIFRRERSLLAFCAIEFEGEREVFGGEDGCLRYAVKENSFPFAA